MNKKLSDVLGEALALVGKATPGRWFSDQHSPCNEGMEDEPDVSLWGQDGDSESFVCNIAFDWTREADAEAIAAVVNLLRQHGEAIAAVLRAVEGAGWQPIETAPKDGRLFLCWVAAERWSAEDGGGSGRGADTSDFDFGRWQSMDDHPEGGYYENMMGQIGDAQDITHWQPLEPPRLVPLDAAGSAEGRGSDG